LDPQTRNHMWEYLIELNKKEGITIFFTTHYMEEAEKVANRIAIIDHGSIIALDTAENLKIQTKTSSLEEAFLALTGKKIREEGADNLDHMRRFRRSHSR
ncbi:MAG: ABC transporter ATP-binding protein, partial [bacterium]